VIDTIMGFFRSPMNTVPKSDRLKRPHGADRSRTQQDGKHRNAEKSHVPDHAALGLESGLVHRSATQKRYDRDQEVDGHGCAEIGAQKLPVEDLVQRQVRGKPKQHRRQREVEDELGEIGGCLFREETRPPGPVAQADQQEKRQRLQKDLDHRSSALSAWACTCNVNRCRFVQDLSQLNCSVYYRGPDRSRA